MTDRLAALLATLIPGDAGWPSGATVTATVAEDLAGAADPVLAALPENFTAGDEAAVQAIEAAMPGPFERVVTALYIAYYTEPAIRRVLEARTGYEARPPQPLGYDLPPFDDALLDRQRLRAPFWRDPDKEP
jgi:hypothetical protein